MKINSEIAQKYINGTLNPEEAEALKILFASDYTLQILEKILISAKGYLKSYIKTKNMAVSFEQIDKIILQSISGEIQANNLNIILTALKNDDDFVERVVVRIKSVDHSVNMEAPLLEQKIIMASDESLLEQMKVQQALNYEQEPTNSSIPGDQTITIIISRLMDFFRINKPLFYLIPTVVVLLIVIFNNDSLFPKQRLIDKYAMDNWDAYKIHDNTIRGDFTENEIDFGNLSNNYFLGLSAYINNDFNKSTIIFANLVTNISGNKNINGLVKFQLYFMYSNSLLSLALTNRDELNNKSNLNAKLKMAQYYFRLAALNTQSVKIEKQHALNYFSGLTDALLGEFENAKNKLKEIKSGTYFEKSQILLKHLK